jgi:integrative and conjugative element protein (TIGR02256 family)
MTAWVAIGVLDTLRQEAALYPTLETGGVLLGYWRDDDVVITTALGPGPDAQRGRTWFAPDQAWQLDQIATVYTESKRTVTYLGDWHTHPGGTPHPSRRDRRTMRAIKRSRLARQPRPLMAIIGPRHDDRPVLWRLIGRRIQVLNSQRF